MIFAVTCIARVKEKHSKKLEGGECGVDDALVLKRVTTLRSKQNRPTSTKQNTATRHDRSD